MRAGLPAQPPSEPETTLFPKDRSITERPFMQFRPFGVTPDGQKIRDVSGVTVKANVDYLEEVFHKTRGDDAARNAVDRLCESLNARITDPAYHVTPKFLRNVWNSYSYEFVCYLTEFCIRITDDPHFPFEIGKHKYISPLIQALGRPFSVPQIFRMFPHFGEKFAKGSIDFHVGAVTNESAVLGMKFTDHVYEQFGPFRKRCAHLICLSAKAGLAAVPQLIHHLAFADVRDRQCIADGDEYCEWEFHWPAQPPVANHVAWTVSGIVVSSVAFAAVRWWHPEFSWLEAGAWAVIPGVGSWLAGNWYRLKKQATKRETLIHEQIVSADTRHEELREAYLEQEHTAVELRRKVSQLTTLFQAGLVFSSTIDRETLLEHVLDTIKSELPYERVMIAFFDRDRQCVHDARMLGASPEVVRYARTLEVPVTDPSSLEGVVLLQGQPLLIHDLEREWDRLHPFNQQLARLTRAKSLISVPLKAQGTVIGSLTVEPPHEHALTQDDVQVMVTVANQIAVALDNSDAYHQIEELNVGLERRIHERTRELEVANEKLRELDRLKSAFVSMVSHELRTPLTSMKGLVENMRHGFIGAVSERQAFFLTRVNHNIDRLTHMVNDLLDLSRIEAGRMELRITDVSLHELVDELIDNLRPQAEEKSIQLHAVSPPHLPSVPGDRDKIFQILTNLTYNAVKFTPAGGRISVSLTSLEENGIQVCVADTGCGIAPADVTHVFDRFYRGQEGASETRGAGLGLAITKSLVELHHGRIWVESRQGEGSQFFFILPTRIRQPST